MAQDWHREIYRGVPLPVPYYAGEIRDHFQDTARRATAALDGAIPTGSKPTKDQQLLSVLTLCASLHGEWVRIHPFANGNGRTARLWANWAALRYGLPPFVTVKPRPAGVAYALAAYASMKHEHQVMTGVFLEMLQAHLAT
jgi:Fic family protein